MQDLLSSEEEKSNDAGKRVGSSTSGEGAQNGPTASSSTSSRPHIPPPRITAAPRSSSVSVQRRSEPNIKLDPLLTDVQGALHRYGRRLMLRDYLDAVRIEWQEVALIVDRTLLLAFVLVTFGATAIILLQAPLSTEFLFGDQPAAAGAKDQQHQTDSGQMLR